MLGNDRDVSCRMQVKQLWLPEANGTTEHWEKREEKALTIHFFGGMTK